VGGVIIIMTWRGRQSTAQHDTTRHDSEELSYGRAGRQALTGLVRGALAQPTHEGSKGGERASWPKHAVRVRVRDRVQERVIAKSRSDQEGKEVGLYDVSGGNV